MNDGALVKEIETELGERGPLTKVLAEMLLALASDDGEAEEGQSLSLPEARAFGLARSLAGRELEPTLREIQDLARAALQALARRGSEGATLSRLREIGEEAVVQAAGGWEARRCEAREDWLSFLVHDLKNPLNTVLNAIWLIRSRNELSEQSGRFLQMIERAARKMEEGLTQVRALERKTIDTPEPPWRRK